jgi:hypothetical protein
VLKTSRDQNYQPGDLSAFPVALDNRGTTYEARNNAETALAAPIGWRNDTVFLIDGSGFPEENGVIRIDDELAHYQVRIKNQLTDVTRGLMGTVPTRHEAGARLIAPAVADMHNVVRDILIRAEQKIGMPNDEANESLEGTLWARVNFLKKKWFTPKARFYSHNNVGYGPLGVQFYDFSIGEPVRWFWDFGDGQVSNEKNPFHRYEEPGVYDVSLTIFTLTNRNLQSATGQGVSVVQKMGYVRVLEKSEISEVLFYGKQLLEDGSEIVSLTAKPPMTVRFYDQTPGNITTRIWNFGDGTTKIVEDPNQYIVEHTYNRAGIFVPNLAVSNGQQNFKRDLGVQIRVSLTSGVLV